MKVVFFRENKEVGSIIYDNGFKTSGEGKRILQEIDNGELVIANAKQKFTLKDGDELLKWIPHTIKAAPYFWAKLVE